MRTDFDCYERACHRVWRRNRGDWRRLSTDEAARKGRRVQAAMHVVEARRAICDHNCSWPDEHNKLLGRKREVTCKFGS